MIDIPTHPKFINLLGRQFHRLVVKEYLGKKGGKSYWKCLCDCGNYSEPRTNDLLSDSAKSCGCLRGNHWRRHNLAGTPEYYAWYDMVHRCNDPTEKAFKYYGARGITICERWMVLLHFIEDMGDRPTDKHSIDRIDNNGHYSCGTCRECLNLQRPRNVRWATKLEQMRNRRGMNLVTIAAITRCATEWAAIAGISPASLRYRVRERWPESQLLSPVSRDRIGRRLAAESTQSLMKPL